jgi:DNA-binding CsgD family transcriptional regulator
MERMEADESAAATRQGQCSTGIQASGRQAATLERGGNLTARELDVLRLLATDGGGNKELARRLGIRPETVKARLQEASRKLGVSTRTQAALWYRDHVAPDNWRGIGQVAGELVEHLRTPCVGSDVEDQQRRKTADGETREHAERAEHVGCRIQRGCDAAEINQDRTNHGLASSL